MFVRTLVAAIVILAGLPAAADDAQVDLALVLAVDVSGSMDRDEQELQRSGYIEAFRDKDVLAAIAQGMGGRIAVTYVEWAGPDSQAVLVPWMLIDGGDAGRHFAEVLAAAPYSRLRGTSISASLAFSLPLFAAGRFSAARQVIDISGDGPNHWGQPINLTSRATTDPSRVAIPSMWRRLMTA